MWTGSIQPLRVEQMLTSTLNRSILNDSIGTTWNLHGSRYYYQIRNKVSEAWSYQLYFIIFKFINEERDWRGVLGICSWESVKVELLLLYRRKVWYAVVSLYDKVQIQTQYRKLTLENRNLVLNLKSQNSQLKVMKTVTLTFSKKTYLLSDPTSPLMLL